MKKYNLFLVILLIFGLMIGCKKTEPIDEPDDPIDEPDDPIDDPDDPDDPIDPEPTYYNYKLKLPSTELLANATDVQVVADAPELLIIEAVLDTYYYYHYETMSGYEYIKVFNNTASDYNLKNHRIVVCNPIQGQNIENEDAKVGNEVLSTGFLFMSLIDEDFIIPSLSAALIWIQPYYWTAGSGSNAFNKPFSSAVIHKDNSDQKGAISQTIDDFKQFWKIEDSNSPVYCLTNMGIIGKRSEGGTEDFFPIYTPSAGTMYTHLNSKLLRSIEIQKFDDQGGTAEINLLNKYSTLSAEKQANPDIIYGKKCFNAMEIKDNGELVDGYLHTNAWKYFNPVVRINFCGLIDTTTMTAGQQYVNFNATSNPGVGSWDNTTGLQFRPPRIGERIMQLQLPLREYSKFETYMDPTQFNIMRFSSENITDYRFIEKTIKLTTNPEDGLDKINWRADEVYSEGRLSSAAPGLIKAINVTRP